MAVKLVPHDPNWSDAFTSVESQICVALGQTAIRVEHVGSTAVPGLLAKPVIDVLVLVRSYDPENQYSVPLKTLGFAYGHRDASHVLFKGQRSGLTFNIHVVQSDASDALDMVTFRDYLKDHRDEAARYAALKQSLALRFVEGRDYAEAKTSYVQSVLSRARASDPN